MIEATTNKKWNQQLIDLASAASRAIHGFIAANEAAWTKETKTMTTDLTKTQLNTILSALDGQPRNPNTKDAALKAIGRHAEPLGISVDDILTAADGLLDGRIRPDEFQSSLQPDNASKGDIQEKEDRPRRSREETKQAKMIAMLRRPEGATVDQIAEVTGWQNHSVRGAIAGALKKKLGLMITTERVRSVGPNKDGARGSYTIYRITDAA